MINVNSGETVNDVYLNDDIMNVFSTGVANGTIVDKDGWVYVSKGGILNNTFINNGGEVDLLASGSANATQIMTDGALYVDANAVASGTVVEGGLFVINSKGIASDTTINATGQMYVSSAGKIKGTTTVNDGGFLTLEWESIHSSVVVQGGKVTVLGGPADGDMAFLQNFTVDAGGSLTVSGSALVSAGTIADGWAKITSNGILEKVTLNAATVEVKNGALLSNAKLKTGAFVNVASGGIIRDLAVSKGAVLTGVLREVSELHFDGGTLDLNISGIAPGGEFLIGDVAYSYVSSSGSYNCTLTVDSSAQTAGVYELIEDATGFDKTITVQNTLGETLGTLMLGGDPLVYGPLSYKLSIDTTGLLSVTVGAGNIITGDVTGETKEVPAGWTALGVNVNTNGFLNVLNGGVASDTTINDKGKVNVSNGGVASNTTVNSGGFLNLYEGGSARGVTINDGGGLEFLGEITNASVEDVKVYAGGKLFAAPGTSVKDIDAEAGAKLALTVAKKTYAAGKYAGTPFEIYEVIDGFTPFGGLGINNDGIAINTKVNKDNYVYVSEGGLASNTTLFTDARMYVGSAGSAHIAYVSGGSLTINDKGSAGLVNVGDLGQVHVSSGGVVSGLICYQYGTLTVSEGGVAGNVTVNKDGMAYVAGTVSGAYISDGAQLDIEGKITGKMTFETGAGVYTLTGPATLDFDLTKTAPGEPALVNGLSVAMADTKLSYTITVAGTEADGDYKLAEGATGFDKTITVKDTLGTTLGTLTVADGKTTIDGRDYTLTLSTGGLLGLTLEGGKTVDLTGDLYTFYKLEEGMYGSSVNIQAGGDLHIKNGASADQLTVNSGGDLRISAGAAADDVTANFGADTYIYAGATVTKLKENGGFVTVYDGSTVEFVPTSFTGYFYNTIDQWATLHSGTTGTKLTAANGGGIDVYNGGIAIDTTIGSLGNLYVLDGGKVTGKTKFDTGATVTAETGAILDFDLTATTPGADALVNGLSFALSQPFSYTITVDGTEAEGDYKLAEGATGFDKTITVVNTSGSTLGTLTVAGGKTTIGGRDYTLTLTTGGSLGLTVAAGGGAKIITGDITDETKQVPDGWTAIDVNINTNGRLNVLNGGVASNTAVNADGRMDLKPVATASKTTINDGGRLHVSFGGAAANETTVNSGGSLYVSSGGTATKITAVDGAMLAFDVAPDTYIQGTHNGSAFEIKDGAVAGYTVRKGMTLDLISGGSTSDVTLGSGGSMFVFTDGVAKDTVVSHGGFLRLRSAGAVVSDVKIESGGSLQLIAGKLTGQMTIDLAAYVNVGGGGVDFDISALSPSNVTRLNDLSRFKGTPTYTLTVGASQAEGTYNLAANASSFASDQTITVVDTLGTTLGTLTVAAGTTDIGGVKYTLAVTTDDELTVTVGGGGVDLTGDLSTSFELTAGMVGSSVNILNGGDLEVLTGGFTSKTTVNSNGDLNVSAGGSADIVTVNFGGDLFVRNGGIATLVMENGGYVVVNDGATVEFVPNSFDGYSYEGLDWCTIHSGTTGTNLTAGNGGTIIVSSGGLAKNTTVNSGGDLHISPNGKADGMSVKTGGELYVASIITGKMTVETGVAVFVYTGATLDFDLTQTTPGADALVNDLSFAIPKSFSYTITVDGTEAEGDYKLAEGAAGFDKTITVVNTSGSTLGTISVGATATLADGRDYTLTLNGAGTLGLTLAGGGITPDLTGDLDSAFDLTAGMYGSSVNILDGGRLKVLNGGFASQTTVNSGGDLYVSAGGSADVVTVNFGGDLYVYNGATATLVKENGGYVELKDGATVEFVPNSFDGVTLGGAWDWATVHSGTTATNIVAAAAYTAVEVYDGGSANNTTVSSGGIVDVYSGGKANGATIAEFGKLHVASGGSAIGIVAEAGAGLGFAIAPGTYAQGTYAGSSFEITDTVADYTVNTLCNLDVYDGGTANNTTVSSGGNVNVFNGGKADNITVSTGGYLEVSSGGTATNIVWTPCEGYVYVYDGAYATFVNTYAGVYFGSDGELLESATTMDGKKVAADYEMYVADGGLVTNTEVDYGDVYVWSGGRASGTTLVNVGWLSISSGGVADNTTINANGHLFVSSGGVANKTTVNDKGTVEGNSGGLFDGVVVNSGGSLLIDNGAKLTGKVTIETGADVTVSNGAIVDFDLRKTTTADPALVNDLSFVGTAAVNYTLTVDGSQLSGTYNLADGATGFDKTITVMSPLGEEYGTLTVGGSLSTAFADYTLNLSGGALTLDLVAKVVVDTTPPVVSNVAADITAPTNGNVTVTADFTDNVAVAQKLFKFNDEPWQDYPTGGVLVTENATVSFMAIDTSSNNSDVVVITIGNIDKIAPTITAITPSTTEPATSVTVTANFADDVALAFQQFKIGDGAWQDYTTGVTVTENATVYFRAADAAGNVANASYDVTNIQTLEPDTTKPTVINVAADITAPTNGSVTVTAEFTDNVAVQYKYYKLVPESLWLDYPDAGVTVTENGTVYFEAVDTSGNVSEVVTFSVTNIDKVAPTITGITPSTTEPAASVTVTATFSDDVALAAQQYKIGGGAWQNYVDGVLVTENALVTFKAVDTAGNETTATYNVTNISSGGGTVVTGDVTGETKDINTGMVASDVNVNTNGTLNVYAGGLASKTTVNAEGAVVVSGGSAVQTTINAGGELFLYAGGKADSTTDSGGTIHVYDGASATNTTLTGNGTIDICAGGVASSTTAENNGWIRVSAGGVTSDTTVKSGGKLILNGGGKITGKMTFETGAVVSAFENSIVDFNIYSLSPANEALVNDLSIVQGTPKYTLTINGAQMLGTYNLAGGAAGFDQTITVQSILGTEVDTLTVGGGATKIGDVYYTLNLTGSDLTVTVASGGEADTTKPVVTNVMASITTPTNGDVTVTASFYDNVAVASSLYRINSGDWQNYTGGVTLTENATVYFKAVDTSGNESDVVSLTVSNIDKTAPEKPVASANVTAPTNGSVNVTAIFAEDSVQNEYSMDGVNWAPYPGMVKFDNNGTVYFRSTDEVGNISEVESYAVTNIDKVPPAKPTASADITTTTSGNVTVTAVFSTDSAKKEFSLDGLVWQDYSSPLVFSENGKAYFRGTDAAGNESGIISYSVTNIQPATPDNAPDDGRNDWVYNKKTKDWNTEENIASFVVNNITAGDSEVRLDKVGSVEKDGKHNYLGRSGSTEDSADYAKIELSKGAALSFSVDSTIAGTFVVLQKTKDKKGNLVTTQRQKISVKAGKTSPSKTTTIYLEAGEYFVGMEAKLPSAKKGDAAAYYNVNLAGTTFFNDADTGWNNTAYKLDGDGKEVKTELNPELVSGAMLFGRGATAITLDTGATGKDGYANWVGFSDATDYRMLTLENAANVTLSLTATGKAKLSIWQVSTNAKGVISLKSKGSVTVKADATGLIKSKFLEAGTYFVSVESTDAKKGGSAYYNVTVDSASVFFDSADTGKNDELYDKKAKAFYPEDKDHHFVTTNVSGAGTSVQLDSDPVKADGYKNFVGYQDKIDYAKINLTTDGSLFFKLKATGDATFTVYKKGQDKKGNDTLETIQTTKLKLAKGASVIDKFTDVISGLTAGEYYISMAATNTSTNAKGSVFYNVTATLEPSVASSLAMPEADTLGMTDSLSFGQFDADVLASASASSLAELDDKSAWQNLALA